MTKTAATTTKCLSCERPLRSAKSIARGRGPLCHARHQAAAAFASEFKSPETTQAKALQLITDKGLVRTRHKGQYLAASSDGTQHYLVDVIETSCTCPAGAKGRHCYHLVAANVAEVTATRRNAAYALAA